MTRDDVDTYLSSFVWVHQDDPGVWVWDFVPEYQISDPGDPEAEYPTHRAAMEAAITYMRRHCPVLVRSAKVWAEEAEKYRAMQRQEGRA